MLTVAAAVFGTVTGFGKIFHRKKNKSKTYDQAKLTSMCREKLQDSKIKISEVEAQQPQTCRENSIANDGANLLNP